MRLAASVLVLGLALALAVPASATMQRHGAVSMPGFSIQNTPMGALAFVGCDNGSPYSGYYQADDDRLGNLFDFGTSSRLSKVSFAHYGFGTPGPYNYGIDVWDPTSCTLVNARSGLVAGDAAAAVGVEDVDYCSSTLALSGVMVVALNPNSCNTPTDCYPDLLFDTQLNVFCPVVINSAESTPACYDVSPYNGPFLLRVEMDNCPTPTQNKTWGQLKSIYR